MKQPLFFTFLVFSCIACSGKHEKPKALKASPKPQLSIQDDGLSGRNPSPLFDSLTAGFELHGFLEDMQFTNNGGAPRELYFFRPQREGFYYSYFGSPRFSGDIFGKLTLITYIYGNEVGRYNEQDETFIGLHCRVNDPALGKLDLVGKPAAVFREHPAVVYKAENGVILQENEQLLKLITENDTIRYFEYTRAKNLFSELTPDEQQALRR